MANEISLFELQRLAETFHLRIWQCRKIGKRWSFIAGAGEEQPLPSQLIFESGETGIFVQTDATIDQRLIAELQKLFNQAVC